jgi:D-aminoacyl-tRNA deacylase
MKFAVLYSKKDAAGINIAEQIKELFLPQILIIELSKEIIYSEKIDKDKRLKDFDFLVFASKHKSKQPHKTLSIHAPGNWRDGRLGGKPGQVCMTSALVLKYLFQKLNENAQAEKSGYECTLECTHHGPYLEKPCCFIEIGSSENEWKDKDAGKIIAKTISQLIDYEKNHAYKAAIGIGGPHYCPNFNKIQLNSEYALSHIIPGYAFPLTPAMLKQAFEKTQEHVFSILLDWKGCGKAEKRQEIINLLKDLGLEFLRTDKIKK